VVSYNGQQVCRLSGLTIILDMVLQLCEFCDSSFCRARHQTLAQLGAVDGGRGAIARLICSHYVSMCSGRGARAGGGSGVYNIKNEVLAGALRR